MSRPNDSSEIAIAVACPLCLGQGGHGSRTSYGGNPHTPCDNCATTGWVIIRIKDLTPAMAEKIRMKLAPIPPDPEIEYRREQAEILIAALLTRHYPETVTFPKTGPQEIHLTNSRGVTCRIFPEFIGGRFHNLAVDVVPAPPPQ